MTVVKAEDPHYLVIQHIAKYTWHDTFKDILSPEQIDYMLEMMYSDASLKNQVTNLGHTFLLVNDDGTYHAFGSYETNHNNTNLTKVHKLYVLPKSQGKGAGKQILQSIENIAKESGDIGLTLNVNRKNPAVEYYISQGWKIIKEEDIDIGSNFWMNDYVMQKLF
jgi:GNAT superfamily N-acetyltransferase